MPTNKLFKQSGIKGAYKVILQHSQDLFKRFSFCTTLVTHLLRCVCATAQTDSQLCVKGIRTPDTSLPCTTT